MNRWSNILSNEDFMSDPKNFTLKAEPTVAVLTPLALAKSAHHMFCMAKNYAAEGDAFLMRQYLFCVAIELGLKAAILGEDCTPDQKKALKDIGHDLLRLSAEFTATFGSSLFDQADMAALALINDHFRQKGLEYFTMPVLKSTLHGRQGMPTLEAMQTVAGKVDAYLAERDFIVDGKSTYIPDGGFIHFV